MSTHNDYTYVTAECPYCKSTIILKDNVRDEIFCTKCGLILTDITIPETLTKEGIV